MFKVGDMLQKICWLHENSDPTPIVVGDSRTIDGDYSFDAFTLQHNNGLVVMKFYDEGMAIGEHIKVGEMDIETFNLLRNANNRDNDEDEDLDEE